MHDVRCVRHNVLLLRYAVGNLIGAWAGFTQAQMDECEKTLLWKKLLFSIMFFHALVLERRKFGPLGWNIRYAFSETDREVSIKTLCMFLNEQVEGDEAIPRPVWDALLYVSGEIHYGGRVTDFLDRRTLMSMLGLVYNDEVLKDNYMYATDSDKFFNPPLKDLEDYRAFVAELPIEDPVGLFGLDQNSKITFDLAETNTILKTITDLQPRLGGGGEGASPEETVAALCDKIKGEMPGVLTEAEAHETTFEPKNGKLNSLQIVLLPIELQANRQIS